jgi:hypothetical protein
MTEEGTEAGGLLRELNRMEVERRRAENEAASVERAFQRIADPRKIEEAQNKVAEVALKQLRKEPQPIVPAAASTVPLENRPLTIVHQEQRRVKKQEKLSRWGNFVKSVNDALGGNS